jgi:hypothetical protein
MAGIDGALKKEAEVRPISKAELRQQAERTVRFAVEYARNGCDYRPKANFLRYTSGLAAYNCWIDHLRSSHIVPNRYGMGHLSAVYAQTKRYASLYLRSIPFEGEAMRLTLLASEAYEQTAEIMEKLSSFVPFKRTAEMLLPNMIEMSALYLEQAKEFETAAIGYLEKALTLIREKKGSSKL